MIDGLKTGYAFKPRSIEDDIIAALTAAGGLGRFGKMISRSELTRLLDNRYRASEIGPALQSLVAQGDVFARKGEPKPKGRAPTFYRLTVFAKHVPEPEKITSMIAFGVGDQLNAALREMAAINGRSLSEEIRDRLIYTLGYHGEVVDD